MLVTVTQAVDLLNKGQLVAIPTETVYGLAADAANDDALTLLYQTKGRPSDHPVILHVSGMEMCRSYVQELTPTTRALMEAFWPGPLTLLLPKSDLVPSRITGGRPLVGVRAPATPLTLELLERIDRPLVAPSANRFGHISPTTAQHVEDEFEGRVAVLDGGPCQVGLESTIVAVEDERLLIMRPGQLTAAELHDVSGLPVVVPDRVKGVPGALESHYAPRQPLRLVTAEELSSDLIADDALLVLSTGDWPQAVMVRRLPLEAPIYARLLYGALREAEASGCRRILLEAPPRTPEWTAVWDRLRRAAGQGDSESNFSREER
jgi:L-threonylcarbamoyladenylate synthase